MSKKVSKKLVLSLITIFLCLIIIGALVYGYQQILLLQKEKSNTQKQFSEIKKSLNYMKSRDEYKINVDLQKQVKNIESGYKDAVDVYEKLLNLKNHSKNTSKFDEAFSDILVMLSNLEYSIAEASISALTKDIANEEEKIAASFQIPQNIKESNTPPGAGFSSQVVKSDIGDFLVYIVAADLNSTRVIVDSASDSDCKNDCPVLPLADYVSRSGAFAGINGSYFCPADYPSCADKKNSFDTLLMNKNKKYINSDNNVYSTVPAVIFSGNSARFVGQSLEWGRDTGVDAVLAMQPLLVSNGSIVFNGDGEPKRGSKGSRSFVGASGSTVYIGVVFNATVAEAAHAIHTMGIQNALNLDDGGSTALWSGGYKAGPGRNLPNALLFVGK